MRRIEFALFLGRIDGKLFEKVLINAANKVFLKTERLMRDFVDLVDKLLNIIGRKIPSGESALNKTALQPAVVDSNAVQSGVQGNIQFRSRRIDDV